MAEKVLLKKYANRRLYDTEKSRSPLLSSPRLYWKWPRIKTPYYRFPYCTWSFNTEKMCSRNSLTSISSRPLKTIWHIKGLWMNSSESGWIWVRISQAWLRKPWLAWHRSSHFSIHLLHQKQNRRKRERAGKRGNHLTGVEIRTDFIPIPYHFEQGWILQSCCNILSGSW